MDKRINSCDKGKRGERKAVEFLTGLGFPCERSARNGISTCDLLFKPGVLEHVHIEIKHKRSIRLGTKALMDALAQAEKETTNRGVFAAVLWFEANRGWRLTFRDRNDDGRLTVRGIMTVARVSDIHGCLTRLDDIGRTLNTLQEPKS